MKKVNVKVEFESTPIRGMAVQCPSCEKWFSSYDISKGDAPHYDYEIDMTECCCPLCHTHFNLRNVEVEDTTMSDINSVTMTKKTVWE